jgi:hypothetical protein
MTNRHDDSEFSEQETVGDVPATFYRRVGLRSLLWRRSVHRAPSHEVEVRYPPVTHGF